MAGSGRAPKDPAARRTRHAPRRGEWQPTPSEGWQHGRIPDPPEGLSPAAVDAWNTWLRAWWAAHWGPGDVPTLHVVIGLFDSVARRKASTATYSELRLWLDNIGVSPKGRQDRRWVRPESASALKRVSTSDRLPSTYAHLKVVDPPAGPEPAS